MSDHASSPLLAQFQLAASELRRDRADLNARLDGLSRLCEETDKLIAESKARIARSLALLDGGPSLVPEAEAGSEPVHNPERSSALVRD